MLPIIHGFRFHAAKPPSIHSLNLARQGYIYSHDSAKRMPCHGVLSDDRRSPGFLCTPKPANNHLLREVKNRSYGYPLLTLKGAATKLRLLVEKFSAGSLQNYLEVYPLPLIYFGPVDSEEYFGSGRHPVGRQVCNI